MVIHKYLIQKKDKQEIGVPAEARPISVLCIEGNLYLFCETEQSEKRKKITVLLAKTAVGAIHCSGAKYIGSTFWGQSAFHVYIEREKGEK